MDGLTHGMLGAAAAHAICGQRLGRWAFLIGAAAGMLADIDYLIWSPSDPLLTLVTHRGFTHSLLFIPVGGLIAALPFFFRDTLRQRWQAVLLAATAAYATHPLLDAANPFGTVLFWPFSRARIAFDIVTLLDPLVTLTLLAGVLCSVRQHSMRPTRLALACVAVYLVLGVIQHQRARYVQERMIATRGDQVADARVMPTFGNLFLYRSLYRATNGMIYVDAIRVPLLSGPTVRVGPSVPAFELDERTLARARDPALLKRDIARYAWVAHGFLGAIPDEAGQVADLRYSPDPAGITPIWGFTIDPEAEEPVRPFTRFGAFLRVGTLVREVLGLPPWHQPPP